MLNKTIQICKNSGFHPNKNNEIVDSDGNMISNFVPIVLGQYIVNLGKERKCYVILKGVSECCTELETIHIDSLELDSLRWIKSNWGYQYKVPHKMKYQFLQLIENLVVNSDTRKLHDQIGWIKDKGEYSYLHTRGVIGSSDIQVDLGEHLSNYFLPDNVTDLKKACSQSLKLLDVASYDITVPLLSIVYLSPLIQAIRDVGKVPEFIVWLVGTTGSRKTSLARVALSHLGDFSNRLPATFNDTYASIEIKSHSIKDSLNLIDDYAPKQTKKQKDSQDEIAEKSIRAYGDRVSRGRANSSMISQKQYIPQGMLLITGESIVRGHSTNARLIALELDKGSVDLGLLKNIQDNTNLLRECMKGYIEWILPQINKKEDGLGENLIYNFDVIRDELEAEYQSKNIHGRTIEACAWLNVGIAAMLTYFEEKGILSEEEFEYYIDLSKNSIKNVLLKHNSITKESSPEDEFSNILKESIDSRSIKIINMEEGNKVATHDDNTYGYKDTNYYYLYPEKIYSYVKDILEKSGNYMSLSKKALFKILKEKGIIRIEPSGQLPKKVINIKDNTEANGYREIRTRFLHIPIKFIEG